MTRLVLLVEATTGILDVGRNVVRTGNGDGDGMLLAAVTQISGEVEAAAREILACERRLPGTAQLREGARSLG